MFTKVLYYPSIDIENEKWLKTAALYWKEINTIVPASIPNPYSSATGSLLAEAGILKPLRVNSRMQELEEIVPDVLRYIHSEEALRVLMCNPRSGNVAINQEKFSDSLRNKLAKFRIYDEKIHYTIINNILQDLPSARNASGGWIDTSEAFAKFYMTLLANKISSTRGIGIISDYSIYDQLTLKVRTGLGFDSEYGFCPECGLTLTEQNISSFQRVGECPRCGANVLSSPGFRRNFRRSRGRAPSPQIENVAPGVLAQIVLRNVSIRDNVDIKEVIKFREKNESLFDSFRGAIQKMAATVSSLPRIETLRALQEELESLYINDIKPQIERLDRKLNENFIQTILSDFKISGVASLIGVAGSSASFPFIGNYALLAGAGVSVAATTIMYNQNRRDIKADPFSYVLAVGDEFGRVL